jgi:hypothetical protein
MRASLVVILVAVSLVLSGCIADAPTRPDTERPEVTLQVRGAVGGSRIFRSTDSPTVANCALIRSTPLRLVVSANDPGGIRRVYLKVFPGTIDRSSIVVPTADDVSWRVDAEGPYAERLLVTLTPPAPGRVRTGIVATLNVSGPADRPRDFAITAEASDVAGNRVTLRQVSIWAAESGLTCR